MEKKDIEKILGRKVDLNFIRECKEEFLQSEKSGELAQLTRERVMPMRATPRKQPKKRAKEDLKADESFWRECREAFIELNDSGELQRHMRQRVLSTKAMPQKPQKES